MTLTVMSGTTGLLTVVATSRSTVGLCWRNRIPETSRIERSRGTAAGSELRTRSDAEFDVGAGQVNLDGVHRDREPPGDLLIGQARRGELDNVVLGRRERPG